MKIWNWIKRLFKREKPVVVTPIFTGNRSRQDRLVQLYDTMEIMTIGKQSTDHISWYVEKANHGKPSYLLVQNETDVPWYVVACVHALEASYSWEKNLMNGQLWRKKTTWVPKGYGPWESWHEAAVDAFELKRKQGVLPNLWETGSTLEFLLKFNGLGYERKGLVSPYLWSYTNHYAKQGGGKYVSDGKFDRNAISLQVGAAVILKELGVSKF